MRIEIRATDGTVEIHTASDFDEREALGKTYAKLTVTSPGIIGTARDFRDLSAACATVAAFLERRAT